jgi:ketosteroid isomerase-like protein
MSREDVDLVRRGYAEFNETGAMPDHMIHPDAVFDATRVMPDMGVVRGSASFLAGVREYAASFDDFHTEVEEILDADDQLVVSIRDSGRLEGSDSLISNRFVHVLTLRDQKVLRLDVYLDKADALEAAGLRT